MRSNNNYAKRRKKIDNAFEINKIK